MSTEVAAASEVPLHRLLEAWPVPLDEPTARALVRCTDPAALQGLALLGAEYRTREHEAPAQRSWPASPNDEAVRRAWGALLRDPPSFAAAEVLRAQFRGVVRRSIAGVATVLRLPYELAGELADRAQEQLDLVLPLARGELAAGVVETDGEPVAALTRALGPGPRRKVLACIDSRALWGEVREILGYADDDLRLAEGTAAAILRRLSVALADGTAAPHELGPPGWGVVAANRARIRGRLRLAAAGDHTALARHLLPLDALAARSADAIGRFAWAWAWREARTGFGFDLDRARSPACEPGPPVRARVAPLGEAQRPALNTLVLLIAGRGGWEDLERWVDGEAGRGLGRGFYRCLEAAPEALLDPVEPGRRSRGYERLRAWLFEGGLESCRPMLTQAADRVRPLGPSRDLRARMREALSPWWDESAMVFPQHHLPGLREGLLDAAQRSDIAKT